ncbi:class II fumarate hydratase [Pelagibacterales bacterium SAG-MED31]|nr:class II fumarate hydratase [Pelagibacterales bacterium SAG-MED31]
MTNKKRTESDSLGIKKIKFNKLWGAQTQRSLENFKIANDKMPKEVIVALGQQKKAAVLANHSLGLISKKLSSVIIKACDQIINLNLIDEFPLSVWQTGSGTQTNMNANEVISNFAIKILKGKVGSKSPIHPNDHVNLSQSSNDTFPSVMHIATNELTDKKLIPAIKNLIKELKIKTKIYSKIIKIGRTHTQDATPLTMGNEFSGYLQQVQNNFDRLILAKKELNYLAQGGTAVGSGINAPKNFDKLFCKFLNNFTKNNYKPSKNKFEAIANHDSLVNFSNTLNTLAISLFKFLNDLRFLSSGPRSGLGEINIPANEPGSSIMPGKVNPTQIEALSMICCQVMGNCLAVNQGGSNGHFELNAFKPLIIFNIINSINLLSDGINSFNKNCLKGLTINKENINKHLNNSLMLVTALNQYIGYDNAAKIAKKAFDENMTLKEAAIKLNLVSEKEFTKIVDPKKMI